MQNKTFVPGTGTNFIPKVFTKGRSFVAVAGVSAGSTGSPARTRKLRPTQSRETMRTGRRFMGMLGVARMFYLESLPRATHTGGAARSRRPGPIWVSALEDGMAPVAQAYGAKLVRGDTLWDSGVGTVLKVGVKMGAFTAVPLPK